MKLAVVIGGSGLIGSHLIPLLVEDGYRIRLLTRRPDRIDRYNSMVEPVKWPAASKTNLAELIENADVLINLAGYSIANLWTAKNKKRIWSSRIVTTRIITHAIQECKSPPKTFVQASAVGIYPYDSDCVINEESPAGNGFLADMVKQWEFEALAAAGSTRVVLLRTGIVLAKTGGFLPKIAKPIRYFVGAILGNGKHTVPWIHITDHIRAIKFLIENSEATGVFNLTAPSTSGYEDIIRAVAAFYRRPILFRVPSFLLYLLPGNMGKEILLANQSVSPDRLSSIGFTWLYPDIKRAIQNLLDG